MKVLFKPGDFFAAHLEPIWRERSDFIISYLLSSDEDGGSWEQIWAQQVSEKKFIVCCIPFFAYNLNLGDEVLVDDDNTILKVVKKSSMMTFRVWLKDAPGKAVAELLSFLDNNDVLHEKFSDNLMAVSCFESSAGIVANYFQEKENKKILSYETGAVDSLPTKLF